MVGAHRLAYETWIGPIPEGHVVRHKCDNPPCINPEHLLTGTHADNSNDMVARGRTLHSERHPAARLTKAEVSEIRSGYATGLVTQAQLAELYGVGQAQISRIILNTKWRE